jgi:hypothetical protein
MKITIKPPLDIMPKLTLVLLVNLKTLGGT